MQLLKQSTAVTIKLGPFVDETDGKTAETGLSIAQADVRLSKNGGNMAEKNNTDAATHDEIGWYDTPLSTTDTGTLGILTVMVHKTGALPVWKEYMVVPANVYDSLVGGSDLLDTNASQLGGTAQTGNDVGADVDAILVDTDALDGRLTAARAGYMDKLNVSGTLAHSDAAATYKADVSALALEATLTAIKGGGWTTETLKAIADALAALNNLDAAGVWAYATRALSAPNDYKADLSTLEARLSAARAGYLDKLNVTGTLAHSDAAATYKADVSALALEATLTAMKGTGWTTETLKAIKDAIDAIETGSGATAQQVWEYATRTLTSAGSGGATAQEVWEYATRILTAGTNIDLSSLATADNLATVDEVADAIKAKTDQLAFTVANQVDANALTGGGGATPQQVWEYVTRTLSTPNDYKADVSALALEATLASMMGAGWTDETLAAIKDAIDAIETGGATVQEVWGHATRTLTNQGTSVESPAEGDPLEIYRDTTVAISLSGLGNVEDHTEIWFTVKEDLEDPDEDSIIQIDMTTGLLRIDGETPAAAAEGSIVFSDEVAGDCDITIKKEAAVNLPIYSAYGLYWDIKMLKSGVVSILSRGGMFIHGTPTRSVE